MNDKEEHPWDDFPRQMPNLTILPWIFWAVLIGVFMGFVLLSTKAFAEEPAFDRAAHIKAWTADIRAHAATLGQKLDWIIEDNGDEMSDGSPVIKVTVPGKHWCLVAINHKDAKQSAVLGCLPLDESNRTSGA